MCSTERTDPWDTVDGEVCEFCLGLRAAEGGEPATANPYPKPIARDDEPIAYVESPWYLWDAGFRSHFAVGRLRNET